MHARDIMTTSVITVGPKADLKEAARLMAENHISGLPVVDEKMRVLGLVSEGDLMRRHEINTQRDAKRRSWWLELFSSNDQLAQDYVKSHAKVVSEVMASPIVTVSEDTPLVDVADILERHNIKRVPVVRNGKLVGVLSRADIVKAFAEGRAIGQRPEEGDRALRHAFLDALSKQSWGRNVYITVTVNRGEIELSGVVESEDRRKALIVLAENCPGAKRVKDDLTIMPIFPMMGA